MQQMGMINTFIPIIIRTFFPFEFSVVEYPNELNKLFNRSAPKI